MGKGQRKWRVVDEEVLLRGETGIMPIIVLLIYLWGISEGDLASEVEYENAVFEVDSTAWLASLIIFIIIP